MLLTNPSPLMAVTLVLFIISIFYYLFLQNYISNPFFLKMFGPNNFSFLLICFTPQALFYIKKRYSLLLGYLLLFFILYIQLSEGRRAGFGLILISGLFTLNISLIQNLRFIKILKFSIVLFVFTLLFNSNLIKDTLYNYSPRIHDLAYQGTNVLVQDRSFHIRLAMIEKGFVLFKENPLTGIGLNNFVKKETQIEGKFEGANYILNKNIFQRTSSHNSYINVLAEGGLLLFVPLILLLLGITISFLRNFFSLTNSAKVMFFSFITMSIHFYYMNAIVNSLAWFNISLSIMGLSISKKN